MTTARAFSAASGSRWPEVASYVAADASLARARDLYGRTLLHLAAGDGLGGDLHTVGLLLAAGADPNSRTSSAGASPLLWAASGGTASTMRALLAGGAHVNQVDAQGRTPLLDMAVARDPEVVGGSGDAAERGGVLVSHPCVDLGAEWEGKTAVQWAAEVGNVGLVGLIEEEVRCGVCACATVVPH
jgi:ankyrin repeat protein